MNEHITAGLSSSVNKVIALGEELRQILAWRIGRIDAQILDSLSRQKEQISIKYN